MQVYQIVRYNFKAVIGGKVHRECTLGPLPTSTVDDAVATTNYLLNGEVLDIVRRVK